MAQLFNEVAAQAHKDPQGFWQEAAKDVIWMDEPKTILDDTTPPFITGFQMAPLMAVIMPLTVMWLRAEAIRVRLSMIARLPIASAPLPIANCKMRWHAVLV